MNLMNDYVSTSHPHQALFRVASHFNFAYSTRTSSGQPSKELIKSSTHPQPIFTINYLRKYLKDPARKLLLEKKKYERQKKFQLYRLRNGNVPKDGHINYELCKFIETMETDPDPTMNDEYNWHLNGGNLEVADVENGFKLLQPSINNKYSLRLLDPAVTSVEHIILPFKTKYHERLNSYEIMKSSKFIGLRKQKSVNLSDVSYLADSDDSLRLPLKFSWESEIAASTIFENKLIFIDVNNKLVRSSIEQLITEVVKDLHDKNPEHQFPISVNAIDQNVISYTNLKSLNLVDFRVKHRRTIFDTDDFLMRCEELSYHKSSLHDNLMYLASSHVLYGLDLRNTKSMVIHWTHQMMIQPNMMKLTKFNNDEVICLSSNIPGDLKIFNTSKGVEENSWVVNGLPMRPHNIKDSYNKLRKQGKFLLSDPIKQRVNFDITGVAMIPKEDNIELYVQNSLNDVFKSHLICKEDEKFEDKSLKKMFKQWDEILEIKTDPHRSGTFQEKLDTAELLVSDIVRLKGLTKVLRSQKFQKEAEGEVNFQMNTRKAPRWRTDLEDEREYRDVLAQHIFAEWELDIADFAPHPFAEALKESDLKKDKGVDKVSRWLKTNSDENDKVEEDVEMPLQEINTQDTNIITQTTNVTTQKTDVLKKPKRVKGF